MNEDSYVDISGRSSSMSHNMSEVLVSDAV